MSSLSLASEIANPREVIRQLVLENDSLKQEQKRALSEAAARIRQLEDQNGMLTGQIVTEGQLQSKLKAQIEHSRQTHENFNKRSAEELRELKVMLKARENDNYSKDVIVAGLDRDLAAIIGKFKALESEFQRVNTTCSRLQQVLKEQQEELATGETFTADILSVVEQYCQQKQLYLQQKLLMREYQLELQHQIEQVQQTNDKLLQRLTAYRGLEQQLRLQNTQNNDFAGLNERLLQQLQTRVQ